jgi:uncharacterized membrane protein YozB (DUF420 family)
MDRLPIFAEAFDLLTTGFIPGSRGSFMLDFVFTAMFGILLVLAWSIRLAKQGKYELHKRVQVVSALVLLVAVIAFEVDMRFGTGWKHLAEPSPYWSETGVSYVWIALAIHLCFAIPTPFIWGFVIYEGFRKFPAPLGPGPHSQRHKRWGWIAAAGLFLTSVTGWIFYALAFVAS